MEHIAKSADRLQVAEHPRDEQAPRTTTATSAGVSWPDVVGKRPGEPALAIVAERHGRDAARPGVAKLIPSISDAGDDDGGCSPARATARRACRSRRSGRQQAHRRLPGSRKKEGPRVPVTAAGASTAGDAHLWQIEGRHPRGALVLLSPQRGYPGPVDRRSLARSDCTKSGRLAGGDVIALTAERQPLGPAGRLAVSSIAGASLRLLCGTRKREE